MNIHKAVKLAAIAHDGQVDKGGKPYFGHCVRVARAVNHLGEDFEVVALLHDVMEDTDLGPNEMAAEGVSDVQLAALNLLTKQPGQDYDEYIQAIAQNPIAWAVKLADLRDNMNLDRLPKVTEADLARRDKYARAMKLLNEC